MASLSRRPSVLVVAYCFPPYAAIGTLRTLRVVRQLDARGWDVTVLTGSPAAYREGAAAVDPALLAQVPAGVRVVRARPVRPLTFAQRAAGRFRQTVRGAKEQRAQAATSAADRAPRRSTPGALVRVHDVVDAALSVPDQESGWLMPAIGAGLYNRLTATPPDVIYSSAPPWTGQVVALALKTLLRRPWVADFRDPWARAPWRGGREPFVVSATHRLERLVVQHADRVVFVTASNRDEFAAHYGASHASKFAHVHNGCDPAEFDALRHVQPPAGGPFVLLHAGSLYAGRTPEPLLAGLALALQDGRIDRRMFRLRFLGTNAIPEVETMTRRLGLADVVEFLPRVPRAQSLRAVMASSCLLLLQPGHTISIPGKAYEYLASGRPVLAIVEEGETARLVRESGAGIAVTTHEPAVIADALVAMVGRAGATQTLPPRELYDGYLGAARIVGILESVVDRPDSPVRLADVEAQSR